MTDATDRALEALNKLPGGWLDEVTAPQLIVDLLAEVRAARVQGMRDAAEIARSVALAAGREAERYATRELVVMRWTNVAKGASDAASSIISAAAALEKEQSHE